MRQEIRLFATEAGVEVEIGGKVVATVPMNVEEPQGRGGRDIEPLHGGLI